MARELGLEGKGTSGRTDEMAIGGDIFGNREGLFQKEGKYFG